MTKNKIMNNLEEWNSKVDFLNLMDKKVEYIYSEGKISKKEKKRLRKLLDAMWMDLIKFHPNNNSIIEEAFELNFS